MSQTWWRRAMRALTSTRVYPSPTGEMRPTRGVSGARLGSVALAALIATGCQSNLFSLDDDRRLGEEAYVQILEGQPLVQGGSALDMVVGLKDRLVAAARQEYPEIVDHFVWEVQLIEDDQTVNAFALPGGKMAVYTGILPVAQTEAGLAVVMGHEIAHVIERHGTEAMTRHYGAAVLIEILFTGDSAALAEVATGLAQLSFGRDAELEADRMGLRFMARAGYDPRAAISFWSRMAELGGGGTPEWLSTHPTHEKRIEQIQGMMPEVLPIYEANKARTP